MLGGWAGAPCPTDRRFDSAWGDGLVPGGGGFAGAAKELEIGCIRQTGAVMPRRRTYAELSDGYASVVSHKRVGAVSRSRKPRSCTPLSAERRVNWTRPGTDDFLGRMRQGPGTGS